VSEKAAYHWGLVRAAVQVSSLLTQGVLANRFNEDTFVAVLARHSRAKQVCCCVCLSCAGGDGDGGVR
jgi:hypothetical protein